MHRRVYPKNQKDSNTWMLKINSADLWQVKPLYQPTSWVKPDKLIWLSFNRLSDGRVLKIISPQHFIACQFINIRKSSYTCDLFCTVTYSDINNFEWTSIPTAREEIVREFNFGPKYERSRGSNLNLPLRYSDAFVSISSMFN